MTTVGALTLCPQSLSVVGVMAHSLPRRAPGLQDKRLVLKGSEGSKVGGTLGILLTRRETDLLRVL